MNYLYEDLYRIILWKSMDDTDSSVIWSVCKRWYRTLTNINTIPITHGLIQNPIKILRFTKTPPSKQTVSKHFLVRFISDHTCYMRAFFASYHPIIWQHIPKPDIVDVDRLLGNAYKQECRIFRCDIVYHLLYAHCQTLSGFIHIHLLAKGYLGCYDCISIIKQMVAAKHFTLKHINWFIKTTAHLHHDYIIYILDLLVTAKYSYHKVRQLFCSCVDQYDRGVPCGGYKMKILQAYHRLLIEKIVAKRPIDQILIEMIFYLQQLKLEYLHGLYDQDLEKLNEQLKQLASSKVLPLTSLITQIKEHHRQSYDRISS